MRKFILSSISMAIAFLFAVVCYGFLKDLVVENSIQLNNFTNHQLALAITAESSRAIITVWLFKHHNVNKSIFINAIIFGLACSILIGSLWILLGMINLNPNDRITFIIDDSTILLLQGILSGVILWFFFKEGESEFINKQQ